MKRLLFIIVILTLTGMLFTSCREEPVKPAENELHDGEWTGYGEGRNGAIVAKVLVAAHRVKQVTIVNQSESVFAQDAINAIVAKAVGRQEAMSVEVDGVTGATLTSTGVIDAINMALAAAMGKEQEKKRYKDGVCDIVVNGRLAGIAASRYIADGAQQ